MVERLGILLTAIVLTGLPMEQLLAADAPRPPSHVRAEDHGWAGGDAVDVIVGISPDDRPAADPPGGKLSASSWPSLPSLTKILKHFSLRKYQRWSPSS